MTAPAVSTRFLQVSGAAAWHAIDTHAAYWTGCDNHAWSVCGTEVTAPGGTAPPWSPGAYPARYGRCQLCLWKVAALTDAASGDGDIDARIAAVAALAPAGAYLEGLVRAGLTRPMLANLTAAAILARACADERDPGDLETIQLLAEVSRHAPAFVTAEACLDLDCEHAGPCPGRAVCPACSLRAGTWADEYDGAYLPECTIVSPCAPLLSIARHFGVTSAVS